MARSNYTFILPVQNDQTGNSFRFVTTLDESDYTYQFDYNFRIDTWFMTITDATGAFVLQQIPMLLGNRKTINKFAYRELLPDGDLQIYDRNGDQLDPGLSNFGVEKTLIYLSRVYHE